MGMWLKTKVLEQNPPKQGLKHKKNGNLRIVPYVLEQNPPKQGLKQNSDLASPFRYRDVLEQNPPKQGLKLWRLKMGLGKIEVLEQNPPKQGLKPSLFFYCSTYRSLRFRAKSTKTRIETITRCRIKNFITAF